MARDLVIAMQRLGYSRFSVAGHDRGGRVAYRMVLDYPDHISRIAVLHILPTTTVWERADAKFALAFWPWSLLAQPEPLPERLLMAAPDAVVDDALGTWGSPADVFSPDARAAYIQAISNGANVRAICEEYRCVCRPRARR
jgi:haloacetate dehalogenase